MRPMSRTPSATITTEAPSAAAGWPVLAVAAVLILAALGAYWNRFTVPFLLDDSRSIGDNLSIRQLGRISDVLSPPPTALTSARPLLNLSFALNYAGGGMSVRGYHAVNLFIHICAGLALLGIVRRTLLLPGLRHRYGVASLPLAAFAGLLWTLHPLQTESVTYISQRAESLMGLFYLLTLYCFIRSVTAESRNCWSILSVTACLCGMATKEVMVTAPVLVLFYDRAFVSGSFQSALAKKRWFYASLAAAWIWLGFLMHRSSLAAASVGFHEGVSWSTYALTELRAVTDYLKLAFWPHPLVFDYGSEILLTDPLAAAPYALIIFAILVGVVIAWRRSPMAGFLGAWFVLILAPTSTVVPIAEQPMAESRMYLPLAAVVVALTLLIYGLGRRKAFAIIGIAAIGLGALTVRRNHDYRSEQRIWEDSLTWQPHTSRGHYNLGVALAKIPDRLSDAIAHYDEALRLKPDFPEAHNNLANALKKIPGRLTDAIAHYEAALRLGSVYAETHYNLANALTQVPGRLPAAIAHYDEALRLKPEYAEAHNNLASILVGMPGRLPEAIAHYEEALRLKPDYADAHFKYAVVLAKMPGRMPEVIAHYEAFIKLTTESAVAHNNLANALVEMPGRLADAITHYEQALRLQPGYAEAHYNFANVLARMPGRMPDAIAHYESAVRNKPDFVEARTTLAAAYAETGRIEAAIEQLEIVVRQDPAAEFARDKLEKLKSMPKQ